MKGVITVPKKIITGAFNIRFDFIRPIEFASDDVNVETLEGDALGHTKDSFTGEGMSYNVLCYLPEGIAGKSRVSVPGHEVEPVEVVYDTFSEIDAIFLDPYLLEPEKRVEVPIFLVDPVQRLRKANIKCSRPIPFQIYGEDSDWTLSLNAPKAPVELEMVGSIKKANGLRANLIADSIRIDPLSL